MIHIFFVPGMFGTSIELVLRNYTNEYSPIEASILNDGSAHSFKKEFHVGSLDRLNDLKEKPLADNAILTPFYPFEDRHLDEILQSYLNIVNSSDKKVLVYADSVRAAELNLLFQYHKIAFGSKIKHGLDIFFSSNIKDFKNWNSNYNSYHDMQPWETREWFSIFYPTFVKEWIDSIDLVDNTWLKISSTEILSDPHNSFKEIIKFCNLTSKPDLIDFSTQWKQSQMYILNEFELINSIVESTISRTNLTWNQTNIIHESIVQQRLRQLGFEIRCQNLNTFPTNSLVLNDMLYAI
jgi:hypothetical protein